MRFFLSVISSIILFVSIANESTYVDDIWIDGASLLNSESIHSQNTIYFPNWDNSIDRYRTDAIYSVAVQLNKSFDPLPIDDIDLPSIEALASISRKEVVGEYLAYLEQFSRTNGIDYVVLPDTAGYSDFEKEVIQMASLGSPLFYIQKGVLNREIPESKKDFIAHVSEFPKILVAHEFDNLKKIKKWSSKYLTEEHQIYLDELKRSKKQDFEEIEVFPERLKEMIFRAGVYAVDSELNLPLTSEEITYLGTNQKLRNWLSKYTIVHSERKMGIKTIVDDLGEDQLEAHAGDIVLTRNWNEISGASQLVLPINYSNQEVLIAKMLFGAEAINGRNEAAREIPNLRYLGFSDPLNEGVSSQFQKELDSIGSMAIRKYATPGMQLAIVKNGSLIYEKSVGTYTYDSLKQVDSETIYDIASLTKVMATLPAIGLLLDRGLLQLDDSVSQYLPEFRGSNKGKATVRQLLAHNAGLKSYVPFWSMIMDGDRLDAFYYKTKEDEINDIRSYGFHPDPVMLDSLRSYIVKSDLIKKPEQYNYSDLGFMILHLIVERITGEPFDEFLADEFYQPMGLVHTTFNPIANGYDIKSIAPTEYDQRFRDYLVWGEVHDRNAAVFGGVSGHAGLFSNAIDLAKMMSMFLNNGYYGGRRYLSEEVLSLFNSRYFQNNRRGLGWDKKGGVFNAASVYASDNSFGHTGFTGTMVWGDPEDDLIFIFLSNRIYPDANNYRLGEYKIRTAMHDKVYESIISKENLKLN